ncbi:MAG: hypothetical protein ACP5L5_03930 [Vulcanisaeta sp.]|uniref:hypothetical protein n=1 Tax=Vulcanisaeta sp. TaxID=2020871 RepID=UPI003D11DD2A
MSHEVLKSYGMFNNNELVLEEVRFDNLPCFINLSILSQGKVPEILIELSTGCRHYNTMIRVTRKFMELFGVDTARIAAAKLARALGIEDYEAIERGDIELRIKKMPRHYSEWVGQNMNMVINAFNEVLSTLGIITQPVITQTAQGTQQESQAALSIPQQASSVTLTAHVVKSYGNVGGQNLVLRSLSENKHIELCLERMGSCKPLITVRAKPLEVVVHEDAVKVFGENRAIEYATWIANALYIANYSIDEPNGKIILRSNDGADDALTNEVIRVMDRIVNKYLGTE